MSPDPTLTIGNPSTVPRAIQRQGGSVDATFDASVDRGSGTITATYLLADEDPYEFSGGGKSVSLEKQPVSVGTRSYTKTLNIVRESGGGRIMRLDVFLRVQLFDQAGNKVGRREKDVFVLSFDDTLADEVTALRRETGASRREVADLFDMSERTVARIEQGHIPSAPLLAKLPKSKKEAKDSMG